MHICKFYIIFAQLFTQRYNAMNKISKSQIRFIRSLAHKKERDAAGVFVAEGIKCTEELLGYFEPLLVAATAERLPQLQSKIDASILYEASGKDIEMMSSLRTPQGVLAVFKREASRKCADAQTDSDECGQCPEAGCQNNTVLALDGVQDPGNLGTIIRTADWFGVSDIVCSKDTADCWSSKVVQSTMGSLSRVCVHYCELEEWLREQKSAYPTLPVYGTLLNGRNIYEPDAMSKEEGGIIIMGNEGNGISVGIRKLITHPLLIPAFPHTKQNGHPESLNVAIATAVTLAEKRRRSGCL